MTPVDQTCHHDPETGNVGDCFRCCIATLLDLPAADVPHFYAYCADPEKREDGEPGLAALQAFLAPRGLYYVEIACREEDYPAHAARLACHYVLSGQSPRGFPHCVVAHGGVQVHDPNPSRLGVRSLDGFYLVGFLARL